MVAYREGDIIIITETLALFSKIRVEEESPLLLKRSIFEVGNF